MNVSLSLHSASFFDAVQDLELGEYDFFDETVRLGREHLSSRVFFQRLDARLVSQKSVVQYVELVVEHAQRVTLYTNNEKNKYTVATIIIIIIIIITNITLPLPHINRQYIKRKALLRRVLLGQRPGHYDPEGIIIMQ